MMNKQVILALAITLAACTTADQPEPPRGRGPMGDGGGYGAPRATVTSGGIDFVPFTDWWHEPSISAALNLTPDQFSALDKIAADQRDEIARLDRDSGTGMRDLRQVLESNQPSTADITTAAQRVRALRDTLFDRQVQMIAAERQVLTQQQWQTLEEQLRAERTQRRDNNYGPRRGGRGGMGGRGRWPGF